MKNIYQLLLLVVCAMLAGCGIITLRGSDFPTVKVPVVRPAKVDMSKFNYVSIGNFEGSDARLVQNQLTSRLIMHTDWVSSGRTESGFDLVKITTHPIARPKTQFSGGIFGGDVVGYTFDKTSHHRDAMQTSQSVENDSKEADVVITGKIIKHEYERKKGVDNLEIPKGMKDEGRKYKIYWYTTVAHITIDFRVKHLKTGKEILSTTISNNFQGHERIAAEDKDPGVYPKPEPLMEKARNEVFDNFVKELIPLSENIKVRYALDPSIPELQYGIDSVKTGDLTGAINMFRLACEKYPESPLIHKAWYDLGLCYMYSYCFPEAPDALNKAFAMEANPHYKEAISECQGLQSQYESILKANEVSQ